MIRRGITLVAGVVLMMGTAAQAQTTVIAGGGSKKSDCYAAWQLNTPANKGATGVNCVDGSSCDADGQVDGVCTFNLAICVGQPVAGCTVLPLTGAPTVVGSPVPAPPSDLATPGCGATTTVQVPVVKKRNNKCKKSKPVKYKMTALVSGKPPKDVDKLILRCSPPSPTQCGTGVTTSTLPTTCPANAAGGPRELKLTTKAGGAGGDLDNGYNGGSHNFPLVDSSILDFCLSDCGGADTSCTGVGATGAVTASVILDSDVYITSPTEVCPQCSGNAVGAKGTCKGGKNDGKPCTVGGLTHVSDAPVADKDFELSADCPPVGSPAATLKINLDPFTTGMASKTGSKPCPGQTRDDSCTGARAGTRDCSGPQVSRGGFNQFCCSNQNLPCFPTGPGTIGKIERLGSGTVPTPQGSFPATSNVILASVFCEGATGVSAVDNIAAGLPGPGALLQPMSAEWLP